MRKRCSKRLAGCIVIELAAAAAVWAGGFRAGTATIGAVRALALEDGRRHRAIFAQADFPITLATADFVAARLLVSYQVERPGLLLRGAGSEAQSVNPDDVVAAVAGALGAMQAVEVRFGERTVSVTAGPRCLAALDREGSLTFSGCRDGTPVSGEIRGAFRMMEPEHGLLQRGESPRLYPVQAISVGKQVAILALGGAATLPPGADSGGMIFVRFANGDRVAPDGERLRAAVQSVLGRVKR
jgi:hypothetical protein